MKKITISKTGKFTLLFLMILFTSSIYAQNLGLEKSAQSLWDEIKAAAPIIFTMIFIISALINIGKLMGEGRDYAAFIRGLLLWFGVMSLIVLIVGYISGLKF